MTNPTAYSRHTFRQWDRYWIDDGARLLDRVALHFVMVCVLITHSCLFITR